MAGVSLNHLMDLHIRFFGHFFLTETIGKSLCDHAIS